MSAPSVHDEIRGLIEHIAPWDEVELTHRDDALRWVGRTTDVFRRTSVPVAPDRHLVSYFVVTDPDSRKVLLGAHRKSGLWLPSGGHVEPGESPVETVRRECVEELGVEAVFLEGTGERPLFVTITDTVGPAQVHTDVSLWFCLSASESDPLQPDPGEYDEVRWWTAAEIRAEAPSRFDPHLGRFLAKLDALS